MGMGGKKFFFFSLLALGVFFWGLGGQSQSVRWAGGVVPHHLLAGSLIEDFFRQLAYQPPKMIVLVGPNHQEKGDFLVLTSTRDWPTADGMVKAEREKIGQIAGQGLAGADDQVLAGENSITDIIPFIGRYLPGTSVIPLVFSGKTTLKEIDHLVEYLADLTGQETLVLSSVDFSHYLKSRQAEKNDEKTLALIKNFDSEELLTLNNDYLDSPPAIVFLLKMMEKRGRANLTVLNHTNSGRLLNDDFSQTTSYFILAFW